MEQLNFVSDKLFVAVNNLSGEHRTRFSVVRYGNVAGSRGSVIPFLNPRFRGKTTLPIAKDMTRFIITLDQGVQFALIHCSRCMRKCAKAPGIKLSISFRFLVRNLIMKSPARPGEKLHEVMIPEEETRTV